MPIVKNYLHGLAGTSYHRSERKKVLCEGTDPYELEEKCLRDEVTELPDVTSIDVTVYLVNSTDFYTHEQMKAYKSLEAHTYFLEGWSKWLKHYILASGNVIVLGKVSRFRPFFATYYRFVRL